MFARLGRLVARHPLITSLTWLVVAIASYLAATTGLGGDNLFARLESGAPSVTGSESAQADDIIAQYSERGTSVTLMIQGLAANDADTAILDSGRQDLATMDQVQTVLDPVALAASPDPSFAAAFTAASGNGFVVVVDLLATTDEAALATAETQVAHRLTELGAALIDGVPDATATVGSEGLITTAIVDQVGADLRTGELIALPMAVLVMVLVFGGLLAASLPLAGALASIGVGLGLLLLFSSFLTINVSVANVITVLGLGLSIDYGLLIVSRYREELTRAMDDEALRTGPVPRVTAPADAVTGAAPSAGAGRASRNDDDATSHQGTQAAALRRKRGHHDPVVTMAISRTLETAGRTITYSALIVAISISGLLVFRPELLEAIGLASAGVVVVALLAGLTLVPALLKLIGRRLAKPGLLSPHRALGRIALVSRIYRSIADRPEEDGVFANLARTVQRRPWPVIAVTVALLGFLAIPVGNLHMRNSGIDLLPAGNQQRVFFETLATQYPALASAPVTVVAQGSVAQAEELATAIAALPGTASVVAPTTLGPYTSVGVVPVSADPGGRDVVELVSEIRAIDLGFPTWTTGQAAGQIDFQEALQDRMWLAFAIVALATLLLLFLMTGSFVLPIKALLINALSLLASLGVLTWVFQGGHGEQLIGFTSNGGVEILVVTIVVAFAFGLSMDYEVFLLSRVLEVHRAGASDDVAVQRGLQHSGRIITSAALIIVLVFAGFVAGDLLVIKQVGFALAVAVAIDATIVRMLVVPATMTVLGKWNWWAPAPAKRLHARLGLEH